LIPSTGLAQPLTSLVTVVVSFDADRNASRDCSGLVYRAYDDRAEVVPLWVRFLGRQTRILDQPKKQPRVNGGNTPSPVAHPFDRMKRQRRRFLRRRRLRRRGFVHGFNVLRGITSIPRSPTVAKAIAMRSGFQVLDIVSLLLRD
jgi:hypothetical protein